MDCVALNDGMSGSECVEYSVSNYELPYIACKEIIFHNNFTCKYKKDNKIKWPLCQGQ